MASRQNIQSLREAIEWAEERIDDDLGQRQLGRLKSDVSETMTEARASMIRGQLDDICNFYL